MEWSAQFDGFRDRFRDGFADVRSEENVDLVPVLQENKSCAVLVVGGGEKSLLTGSFSDIVVSTYLVSSTTLITV